MERPKPEGLYAGEPDFARAIDLGLLLSIQPNFVAPADDGSAMEDSRVGIENSRRVYAWGRLSSLGARMAFGSDYFTTPLPPLARCCRRRRRNRVRHRLAAPSKALRDAVPGQRREAGLSRP